MRVWKVVKQEYTREYTPSNKLNLLKYSNKSTPCTLIRVSLEYGYTLHHGIASKMLHKNNCNRMFFKDLSCKMKSCEVCGTLMLRSRYMKISGPGRIQY